MPPGALQGHGCDRLRRFVARVSIDSNSRDFLAGATVRADYESVRNTIDCPERVYGLLGSEPLATSDQTNLVVRLMHQTKRPRSLLLIPVPN